MIARFWCQLFGHARFIDCEEWHLAGVEGVHVRVRCPRCRALLEEYQAPF